MEIPRTASVQEKLIPNKRVLAQMQRDIQDKPSETAEWALEMLEAIRHDAREGRMEKRRGEPLESSGTVSIYRRREGTVNVYDIVCVRHGPLGHLGQRWFTLDSARFAAASHDVSHKEARK